ncbi:MAG: hypothetical protein ACO20X_13280 [Alphaproteobacteria bacterium]
MSNDTQKIDDLIGAGYHPKDIAMMLGCNEASVRVRACRRGSLRRRIQVRLTLSVEAFNRAEAAAEKRRISVETYLQQKLEEQK